MSDKKKKEILKEPQEEFIDDGIAEKKEPGSSDAGKPLYEKMKLEELHRQARLEGVENYIEFDRDELINKLNAKKTQT